MSSQGVCKKHGMKDCPFIDCPKLKPLCSHCDQDAFYTLRHVVIEKNEQGMDVPVYVDERVCAGHWQAWVSKTKGKEIA